MPVMDYASWRKVMSLALSTLPVRADACDVFMAGTIFDARKPAFSVYGNRIVIQQEAEGDRRILRDLGIDPEGI